MPLTYLKQQTMGVKDFNKLVLSSIHNCESFMLNVTLMFYQWPTKHQVLKM